MSELAVNDLLSVSQAIDILDSIPLSPRTKSVALFEAHGLRLAEDLFSDRDYPPFDKAVMDGYAIRADDELIANRRLRVIDSIAAGQVGQRPIQAGEAIKIMTGAPLPAGADAVVPVEWTTRDGTFVALNRTVKLGNAISTRGSDTPANQLLLEKGTKLGPAQIAVAASIGKATLLVYLPPTVSLLTTGDEIIEIDETPTGAQIRNSNGPMMIALLQQLGCRVNDLGIVRDDPAKIRAALETGLQADALFVSGGMSMGDHDYVPMLLRELRMELRISKLRIKPGKPFVFASAEREGANPFMAFGLPGNPVSAYVCTVRLAARVLKRLAGGMPEIAISHSELTQNLPENGPREFYLPAIETNGKIHPLDPNGSADLFTLARANALIVRAENARAISSGDSVAFIRMPG